MAFVKFLRKQQQTASGTAKMSLKGSSSASSAYAAVRTTSVASAVPARRVSDPDIDTRRQHNDLGPADDASVASSSSDEVSVQLEENFGQFDDPDETEVMGQQPFFTDGESVPSRKVSIEPETASVPADCSVKTQDAKIQAKNSVQSTQLSFQDMFERFHANRLVKRRYSAVKAFPELKPFEGFHESNTAEGRYTFGPYFDRWYGKQQERSKDAPPSLPTRKRPAPSTKDDRSNQSSCDNIIITIPASPKSPAPKKIRTQSEASSIQQQRNLNSLHKWNAVNALYRSEIFELPEDFVPGPYTVIMGRRLKAPGCVHLRYLTDLYARDYKMGDAVAKSRIVTNILKEVYEKAPVGAFVRCKMRRYYEVEDLIAREKIVSELVAGGLQI